MLRLFALMIMLSSSLTSFAGDGKSQPKTLMLEPGKSLLSDDLTSFGKEWKVAKGDWKPVAGQGIKGRELKDDMHGAVARLPLKFSRAIMQFEFKLDGAKQCSLSLNDTTGHVARVMFNATGFQVNKDKHDKKDDADKAAVLQKKTVAIKPGDWHTLTVEFGEGDFVAVLDGQHTAYGHHEAIKKEIANIGFTIAGEYASYRQLKIWDGTVKADWTSTKEKLKK